MNIHKQKDIFIQIIRQTDRNRGRQKDKPKIDKDYRNNLMKMSNYNNNEVSRNHKFYLKLYLVSKQPVIKNRSKFLKNRQVQKSKINFFVTFSFISGSKAAL